MTIARQISHRSFVSLLRVSNRGSVRRGPKPGSKRLLRLNSGLLTSALGLAIIVSFLGVSYAGASWRQPKEQELSSIRFESSPASALFESAAAQQEQVTQSSPPVSLLVGPLSPLPTLAAPRALPAPASSSTGLTRADVVTKGRISGVNITFYDCASQGFCGNMYNGRKVYEGAAACSWNLAIGTKFVILGDPTGRVYNCEDRGLLANTWVDIFWYYPADGYRWQSNVGRYGTIEIVEGLIPPLLTSPPAIWQARNRAKARGSLLLVTCYLLLAKRDALREKGVPLRLWPEGL